MAEVKIAIAKTPKQAEALGKTITKTINLNETEAKKARDYYNSVNKFSGAYYSALAGVVVSIVTKNLKELFQLSSGFAVSIFTSIHFDTYCGQLADKFDLITNDNPKKFVVTYKYKRLGSNDGAYWLTNITLK